MSDQLTSRIVCELMHDITSASLHVARLCDMANDQADNVESRDALCGAASTMARQIGLLASLSREAHTFEADRINTLAVFWMVSTRAQDAIDEAIQAHRTNGKAEGACHG